ncbi:MAG TPA: hypothetical protein VK571_02840 [Gemmatimonadaceae bacterium]|nr:hypothetical protein [Gemmatimonadaceae bacterium]
MIRAGDLRNAARAMEAGDAIAGRIRLAAGAALAVGFMQISCAKVPPTTDTTAVRASPTVAALASPSPAGSADSTTQVAMRKVNFYIIPNAALRIRMLRGTMRSLQGGPVLFDDKNAFVIGLDYAEIGLNGNDLTTLMNNHIFAYPGAPLKRLKIRTSGSQVVQSGIMHKILDIPFEITADLSVTPAGLIRLHPVKTRILGVNGDDLMKAFGLSLEKILDLSKAKGVTVKGNDLFLDPIKILPPPAIEGHATAIRIDGDELVQTFGSIGAKPPLVPPDTSSGAYMYYRGGTLRFGKLLMLDADMEIVDLRPTGFFSFSLDQYQKQLVAGYERTLANGGLLVYMLGVEKLGSTSGPAAPPKN